jgi:hypothetical protein
MRRAVIGGFLWLAALSVMSGTAQAAEQPGHRFGEWPAISAVIAQEHQKNLNLDDKDFLIEIWFKPLATFKAKGGPNVLISKKCADTLPGYSLSYLGDTITLALCDHRMELDDDASYHAHAGLKEGKWCYFAAAYCHRAEKLVLFVDGKRVQEFKHVKLGDLSNKDPFNIGYYENVGNTSPHCDIRQASVWKVADGLPENIAALIAAHHQQPDMPSESLTNVANFSRWVFGPRNDDIADLGNNGNTLCYTPWHYKDASPIKPFPAQPTGTTYYVDSAAAAEGDGSKDSPFRTIKRGAKVAGPGDVLHVCRGTYRESIFLRAGENGKPVTIEGEPGSVVCGSDPIGPWQPAGEGLWQVARWTGRYDGPSDVNERDERSNPTHLLFVDDYPLDYVKSKAELVPGTWHLEPLLGGGPKTVTICPLPGVDPTKVPVEITNRHGLTTSKFNLVRGLYFLRAPMGVRGMGNVIEDNTIAWAPFCTLGIYGQYHVIRGNRILWGGNSGVGGSSYGLRFEHNLLSYNGWRDFDGGWHGGAVKLIPANADHVMRHNEVCYNCLAGVWYDTNNQGNLLEWNHCHDNATIGLFDEFCFGNTFQYNLIYNNVGMGLGICNTSEDTAYRNIFYNNDGSGLFFRWDAPHKRNSPAEYQRQKAESGSKLDVRRYQGLIPYEREKRFRDFVEKYTWWYPEGTIVAQSKIFENVMFNDYGWGGVEVNQPVYYGKGVKIDAERVNTFDRNIYWNPFSTKIFTNGRYCMPELDLAQWQKLSGQDAHSQWLDPLEHPEQMPQWFQKRFPFKKGDMRPIHDIITNYIATAKNGVAKTILMARLIRSKRIEPVKFTDPMLFGLSFDAEGKRCVGIWSRGAAVRDFLVGSAARVTVENKFKVRKELEPVGGRLSLFVSEDPLTLVGFDEELREDRSVLIEVPQWTEPKKPVVAKILLQNIEQPDKDFDLQLSAGPGWKVSPQSIKRFLKAGEKADVAVTLRPVEEIRQGAFPLRVAGTAGGAKVDQAKYFGVGFSLLLKHVEHTPRLDGSFLPWSGMPPSGVADTHEQVVAGADRWNGPDDLSAKVWLAWAQDRELYFAVDVTDDALVTKHRDDNPTQSDSVELFVDVRSPWKQYMKSYSPGVFKIIFVPADEKTKASFRYDGPPFGAVTRVTSKKTAKGYRLEADIHFHTGQVEDPGWVAKRPVRIGVLVYDSDNPAGKRKSTLGLWRTAADVGQDCTSMTTFVTEK